MTPGYGIVQVNMGTSTGGLAKRILDIAIGGLALIVLAPVVALVTAGVLVSLGRPVLFSQQRPGLFGRLFSLRKFRTMRENRDAAGRKLPDAQRLTRFGAWLRATSLDEIPELFNVLTGEMSLVGPRPLLPEYLPLYSTRQARRHELRPGITGWAQVNGRNAVDWGTRLEMDVWYVENQSLALDLKILGLTVLKVLRREGISSPGHATMEPFRGEH